MKNKLDAIKVGKMIWDNCEINIESKMTTEEFLKRLEELQKMSLETARKKNNDYAGIDDPFKNFKMCENIGICSTEKGILVRMTDKMQRIANLLDKEAMVKDESILDTLQDLSNYALILRVYLENK
jgi:DNA repair exonuclease SbcCD nuclease subunit